MRALAKCETCGQKVETDCRGCIEGGNSYHKCKGGFKIVENIKWKIYPENEKELREEGFE